MKKYIIQLILFLTATFAYGYRPMAEIVSELQDVAIELYGESEEACYKIIEENKGKLTQALEPAVLWGFFREGYTIKLLKLQDVKNKLRATSIPFEMPAPAPFLGMEQKVQKSSVLKPGEYPTGNYVWCTFNKQCLDRNHERLYIAFFQTFKGEHKNLGVYTYDIEVEDASSSDYLNRLIFVGCMQGISAFTHYLHVPLANHGYNTPELVASWTALLSTYFMLTPYDFLSGVSIEFSTMTREFGAFILALAGNYYANPTPARQTEVVAAWLLYLTLGTLQNNALQLFSDQKVEDLQDWLSENSQKFITTAVGMELLSALFQIINYGLALPEIQRQQEAAQNTLRALAVLRELIPHIQQPQ